MGDDQVPRGQSEVINECVRVSGYQQSGCLKEIDPIIDPFIDIHTFDPHLPADRPQAASLSWLV